MYSWSLIARTPNTIFCFAFGSHGNNISSFWVTLMLPLGVSVAELHCFFELSKEYGKKIMHVIVNSFRKSKMYNLNIDIGLNQSYKRWPGIYCLEGCVGGGGENEWQLRL